MRIASVEAVPVRVPRAKPMMSAGTPEPLTVSDFGIVRVAIDGAIEGLGEISMNVGRTGADMCEDVNMTLGPALVGRDVRDVQGALVEMDRALDGGEPAKAGIEMALLDLVGKSLGVPVYQLLGGCVRERVPVRWGLGFGSPEAAINELRPRVAAGHRTVKLKIGRPGTDLDLDMVEAVRQEFGDTVAITVDANGSYSSTGEALHELRRLAPHDLQLIEQPLPRDELEAMAAVRAEIGIPILADESVRHPRDAYRVARAGAADALSIYVSEAGGLIPAAKAFAIGEGAGLPCTIGSQCELGIGTAAMAHLGVAMPNLAYASDISGHLRYEEDIIVERLDYMDGAIRPPRGPGLGVTLDEERLNRWRLDRRPG